MERHALNHIAQRHAEQKRGHKRADKKAPIPSFAPGLILNHAAVFKAHRPEKHRPQHRQHCPIKAGKSRGIHHRPSGKNGACAGDEPGLVALPVHAHAVDHNAALFIGFGHKRQQRADAHIVAVHNRKAD
jgi:hypothetical protein